MENEQYQPATHTSESDLRAKIDSIHQVLLVVLLVLVMMGGTLAIFLRSQLKEFGKHRAQAMTLLAREPVIDDMLRKFQAFGKTNPDFVPILNKYGIDLNTPIGATNRAPASATAPAPAKK